MGGESWAWVSDEYRVLKGACGVNINITQAAIEAGARAIGEMLDSHSPFSSRTVAGAAIKAALPHLQDCKVPVCSTCGGGKDDSPWCSNGFHFGGKPRPTMPHAATATDVAIEEVEIERVAEVIHFAGTSHEPLVRKRGACPTEWRMLSDADYKDAVRISARAAIRAIRDGGERWAVYCKEDGGLICSWNGFPLGPTTDKAYLLKVFEETKMGDRYWVRPHTPARAKTPEDVGRRIASRVASAVSAQAVTDLVDDIAAAIRDASKEDKMGSDGPNMQADLLAQLEQQLAAANARVAELETRAERQSKTISNFYDAIKNVGGDPCEFSKAIYKLGDTIKQLESTLAACREAGFVEGAENPDIQIISCTRERWSADLFDSQVCVTDATGTVRVFVQKTSDPTVEDVSLIQHKPDSAVARVEGRGA
jgi:uncharacterized coiled-coil protein SlyX